MRETEDIQENHSSVAPLDMIDRKILGVLVNDASLSYAKIGEAVALSAPAVHERVKRLRKSGVIKSTSALLDGAKIGKPLLVFIHVATENWGFSTAFAELKELPEVEEVHSVTGDTSLILKVRLPASYALESFLRQIHKFDSVMSTKSFVTLSTYQDRPVQAETTINWPKPPLPVS